MDLRELTALIETEADPSMAELLLTEQNELRAAKRHLFKEIMGVLTPIETGKYFSTNRAVLDYFYDQGTCLVNGRLEYKSLHRL